MSCPPLPSPFLYAISNVGDPAGLPGFLSRSEELAAAGIDAIQVREKGWDDRAVLELAAGLRGRLPLSTLVLVNRRYDIALAAGADGVHLPSDGLPASEVRRIVPAGFRILVSCHAPDEVEAARDGGADAVTFGPIFETPSKAGYGPPAGVDRLGEACRAGIPVIALGGISSAQQASACLRAGAAGIAAIRLFHGPEPAGTLLRSLHRAAESDGKR